MPSKPWVPGPRPKTKPPDCATFACPAKPRWRRHWLSASYFTEFGFRLREPDNICRYFPFWVAVRLFG